MSQLVSSESLLLVRLTLEMAAQLKYLYPASAGSLREIEAEVSRAGDMLLEASSIARARTALEMIHRSRLKLQDFAIGENLIAA